MSAATKSNKGGSNNSFETYRQIAPEALDDQRLKDIIKNNKNDHNAIVLAIENIWHDTPDQKAVGSEWVTTSKPKKQQDAPASKPLRDVGRRETGGRGGAGRGRSLPPAGGRGGDARGAPRSSSVRASDRATASPVALVEDESETVEEVVDVAPEAAVAPAPVATVAPVVGGVAWGRGGSLAQKLKEAEKQKEVEKVKTEVPIQVEEDVTAAPANAETADAQKGGARARGARRPRGASAGTAPAAEKRGAEDDVVELTAAADALVVEEKIVEVVVAVEADVPPPPPLVQVVTTTPVELVISGPEAASAPAVASASSAQQGYLNMGKWEAPVEAAEISAFQFGSFGNVYGEDDSASSSVSASQVGTNPSAAPWTGLHSSAEDKSNVWGTPSDQSLDISGGLFAQQAAGTNNTANKVEPSSDASLASSNVAATRAPPGLAQNKGNNNTNNNTARPVGQQTKKAEIIPQQTTQQQAQLPAYHQQQPNYNQQGIPPGMNNRNPLGLNPLGGALPYPYNPSFDLLAQQQAAQYGGYALGGPQVPPLAPAPATSSGSSTTSSAAASASSTTSTAPNAALAQQQAQQQQYAQQAPFPYYPNPYYPNQAAYYYGQQMPNFYGQNRDMYQQRPYGNNPYGNAGSLYPGDVYGQQGAGQFPDASGNYGGLPVHMQGAGAAASSGGNKAAKGPNAGNAAGAVGGASAAQGINPDQHTANLLMNSGYGYVNPYNQPRDGGWQQQQQQGGYPNSQAGGWPMMYPGASSPSSQLGGVGAGFPQQNNAGAAQQGQQQGQGNNRGNNNSYGNNSFGGRGAGGAAPASAGGVPQNW